MDENSVEITASEIYVRNERRITEVHLEGAVTCICGYQFRFQRIPSEFDRICPKCAGKIEFRMSANLVRFERADGISLIDAMKEAIMFEGSTIRVDSGCSSEDDDAADDED